MIKEPFHNFLDGFYIWFDEELKKEYYVTPMYLYKVKRKLLKDGYVLSLEKDISKVKTQDKEITKCRADLYEPYVERLGMFLINFINADFSNWDTAYNTFYYAYSFELVKEYVAFITKYNTETELIKTIKMFFERSSYKIRELQKNYRECVNFIYNLNGDERLKEYSTISKFYAYMIENNNLYGDSRGYDIVLDDLVEKHEKCYNQDLETLVQRYENNDIELKTRDIYTSENLRCICYIVLKQIVQNENIKIKQCQNCGRYFIPVNRQAEVYCDLPNVDGTPTCREKGAELTYKNNLESSNGLLEYRRSYQKKIMEVSRNKEDKKLKEEFDQWKKKAQKKVKEFKQDKITDDELYEWIMENK